MSVRNRFAIVPVLLLAVACGGSTSSGSGQPTVTPQPSATSTTPQPSATTTPPPAALAVHVYFLRGEKVASVHRDVSVAYGLGASAAMRSLLAGPTAAERANGLSSTIPATSRLLGLSIKNGTADVNLNAAYESGGGSLSMMARLMQVVFTLTQFMPVQRVTFSIEGKHVTTFGGEGIMLEHPVTRADYESFLPPIFIDSPAIGETVSSPLTVRGVANVFEGDFLVEVTNASGKTLVRKHAHAAMGQYADFTLRLRFARDHGGPGRVTAFDYSARDGSRIDDYVVPVVFG